MSNRARPAPQGKESRAKVHPRRREAGVELQCFLEADDGFFRAPRLRQCRAKILMCLRRIRGELDRPLQLRKRLGTATARSESVRVMAASGEQPGFDLQRAFEMSQG